MKHKEELIHALCRELKLRKTEIHAPLKTIYFGGGTPSLLSKEELHEIFDCIDLHYSVEDDAEITLEANPDDLTEVKLKELAQTKINRLSIGVQSFFEADLQLMNRAHNAAEALQSISTARKYFDNLSIDLIYGIPGMSNARWKENLKTALRLEIPHISAYALTVEPRTALYKFIEKGKIKPVDDEAAKVQFEILNEQLEKAGFEHYEFSNFGKVGYFSQNNLSYWYGKPYLGIGPAAHSYNGNQRSWNIANNLKYIQQIQQDLLPQQRETLSTTDKYNEFVMTRLRIREGIPIREVEEKFGPIQKEYLLKEAQSLIDQGFLLLENGYLHISKKGKFLADGISADLFFVEE